MSCHRRRTLSAAVSAALLGLTCAGQALAQSSTDITEIITTANPIRDSQKAAIEAKRNANNYMDVVSADTIGRFPDQNLADSLGRMPGLAIERDQGQARYINFRGAPFRYTTLAIDGVTIPGAENGRVPRFDAFPSVITSRIEANKAITPDMPGESVAGYINLSSFNPFDRDGFSMATDIGLGEQNLGGGTVDRYSARLSWSGETLGISLYGSRNRREQTTDNRELDLTLDADRQPIVNELDFRSYKVERRDRAFGGHMEYRPAGNTNRFFFSSLNSEFRDDEQRNQYVFDIAGGAEAMGASAEPGATGSSPLVLVNRLLEQGLYENSTGTHTLGADLDAGDWYIEARLNRTRTDNLLFLPIPYSAGATASASWDVSNVEDPRLSVAESFSDAPVNLATLDYAAQLGLVISSELEIDATKAMLDAERDIQLMGQPATLKIGAAHEQREGDGFGFDQGIGAFPEGLDISAFDTGASWDSDFRNGIDATYYDNNGLRAEWERLAGGLRSEPSESELIRLDEDISALYAMATVDYRWGNVVAGARVEHTDYISAGSDARYSDSFTHVLPSAHANIDLRPDLKLRLSASSAISRPTYNEWRASALVNAADREVSGGNPSLRPEEAWGMDASLEWYYGDASLMSAGVFTRRMKDVIYADSSTVDGGIYLPEAAGQDWSYTGFVNGDNGRLQGVELNVIAQAADVAPGLVDGLGADANLTLLNSRFDTLGGNRFSLPGTSDVIFNTSIFYETDSLSLRLSFQHRDDWLSTTENDSMAEYWAAQERLDLSARYDLPFELWGAALTGYLNVNNLNDAVDVRYVGDERTPNQVERYGRRFIAGIRANF